MPVICVKEEPVMPVQVFVQLAIIARTELLTRASVLKEQLLQMGGWLLKRTVWLVHLECSVVVGV
jgi:hypothetical protein